MKIYKYPVPMKQEFTLELPQGARILTVDIQDGVVLWALVDPFAETEERWFLLAGTGYDFDFDGYDYVGTFQTATSLLAGGTYVGHLWVKAA